MNLAVHVRPSSFQPVFHAEERVRSTIESIVKRWAANIVQERATKMNVWSV
jgi:hypothetical protein